MSRRFSRVAETLRGAAMLDVREYLAEIFRGCNEVQGAAMSIRFVAAFILTIFLAGAASAANPKVADWFSKYSEIRHRAQMSPQEKEKSGQLMTQGLMSSVFQGPNAEADKEASQALLKKMVDRYTKAMTEMDALPAPAETKKLHLGYKQYFTDAKSIFSDYLKVQGNLFATDSNGNSILGQMTQRKAALETLDAANKDLDAKLRQKFSIPAYPW
jgi:hypothetical protein